VLKIGVPKIDAMLSWIEVVRFRQEYVGVGFANMLQLGVVTLLMLKKHFRNAHSIKLTCPMGYHVFGLNSNVFWMCQSKGTR